MISKLDKKGHALVGFLAAIALSVGFYMLYYSPSHIKMDEVRRSIKAKEKEIKHAKDQVALYKPLMEQVARLEEQLDNLRAKTATSGEIISLIRTIEDEAKRLDLDVVHMFSTVQKPPPPTKENDKEKKVDARVSAFTKIILDISLRGKFDKLEEFMATIQHLETFLIVDGLDIIGAEKIYPKLTSNMKINLYNNEGVDQHEIIR